MFQVQETSIGGLRYAGRSKALVTDNRDPEGRGRIKVNHLLLGEDTVWIPYLTAPGTYTVPDIGDVVFVEADTGIYTHPIAWGNFTKKGGGAVPDTFLRPNPTNRGMYSKSGHLFELDDGTGSDKVGAGVRVTTSGLHIFHMIDDEAETNITLKDSAGNGFVLDTLTNTYTLQVTDTTMVLDDSGYTLTAKADATINVEAFILTSKASTEVKAKDITLTDEVGGVISAKDGKFSLTGASGEELLSLLDETLTALASTTAPGYGAPISSVATFVEIQTKLATIKG